MEVDALLLKWEEAYKKGLLSFWILLLLHERPQLSLRNAAVDRGDQPGHDHCR